MRVSPPTLPAVHASARLMRSLIVAASATTSFQGVDNLLAASEVADRIGAGAKVLRVEADFVTCSQ